MKKVASCYRCIDKVMKKIKVIRMVAIAELKIRLCNGIEIIIIMHVCTTCGLLVRLFVVEAGFII